jgi:hypothetical protein
MRSKTALAFSIALMMILPPALAEDLLVIEGNYLQNQPCQGNNKDPDYLRVKITPQEISYAGGVCSIDERQQDGKTFTMRVTCKFKSGAVVSDKIAFTVRNEKTLDMVQKDGSYTAVLSRCPG